MKRQPPYSFKLCTFKTDEELENAIESALRLLVEMNYHAPMIQGLIVQRFYNKSAEPFKNAFREWLRAEYADHQKASY
jgi:hypothetical protein